MKTLKLRTLLLLVPALTSLGLGHQAAGQDFDQSVGDVSMQMALQTVGTDPLLEAGRCVGSTVYLGVYNAEILPAVEELRPRLKSLGGSVPNVADILKLGRMSGIKLPDVPSPGIVIRVHPSAHFDHHVRHSPVGCAVAVAKSVLPLSEVSKLGEIQLVRDSSLQMRPSQEIWIEVSAGAQ